MTFLEPCVSLGIIVSIVCYFLFDNSVLFAPLYFIFGFLILPICFVIFEKWSSYQDKKVKHTNSNKDI